MTVTFQPVAERAVLVSFGEEIDAQVHARVLGLDRALSRHAVPGVVEVVPALVNLIVVFDVTVTDHASVEDHIRRLLPDLSQGACRGMSRMVHVCYDPPFAPDLEAVAKATGQSPDAVIAAHLSGMYEVLMYGFAPGYAYMSGVPEAIQVPRKPSPVRNVPAGSVIIAGAQCLVTTLTMPTGWSIIGRSPTPILQSDPARPFLFEVGDRPVFERIDRATFERMSAEVADA